jgi:BNR/Asp-box repeat
VSRDRRLRRVVRVAAVIAVLAASGCGGDDDAARSGSEPSGLPAAPPTQANRVVDPALPPPSINALDVDSVANEFLLTTNRGFFRIGRDSGEVTQVRSTVRSGATIANVGTSLELAVTGRGRLIGSGHPDEGAALPEFLGVMTSADGGRTWRVVSRLGEADLHKIVIKHDRMYGFDAVMGALLVSRDDGRTFSEQYTPSGVPIADLEVDPDDPRRIVAASDTALYRSTDGGATWKQLGSAAGSRLAWPAGDALFRALKDGSVQRSTDGGGSWRTTGRIDGEPFRVRALSAEELYLVIGDGTILHSRDGAKTWEPAFEP